MKQNKKELPIFLACKNIGDQSKIKQVENELRTFFGKTCGIQSMNINTDTDENGVFFSIRSLQQNTETVALTYIDTGELFDHDDVSGNLFYAVSSFDRNELNNLYQWQAREDDDFVQTEEDISTIDKLLKRYFIYDCYRYFHDDVYLVWTGLDSLKRVFDIPFCGVIVTDYKVVNQVKENQCPVNWIALTIGNGENTQLYYGQSRDNCELMYSNHPELLKVFCGDNISKLETNTCMINYTILNDVCNYWSEDRQVNKSKQPLWLEKYKEPSKEPEKDTEHSLAQKESDGMEQQSEKDISSEELEKQIQNIMEERMNQFDKKWDSLMQQIDEYLKNNKSDDGMEQQSEKDISSEELEKQIQNIMEERMNQFDKKWDSLMQQIDEYLKNNRSDDRMSNRLDQLHGQLEQLKQKLSEYQNEKQRKDNISHFSGDPSDSFDNTSYTSEEPSSSLDNTSYTTEDSIIISTEPEQPEENPSPTIASVQQTPFIINQNREQQSDDIYYHEKFDQVLTYAQLGEPIMLVGPAGSGKNVIVQQVADALGVKMRYINNASDEFKLTGYMDAGGVYHGTEFYDACVEGGVFFLDEIDASDANALIILNSVLANHYMTFPHKHIDVNPDLRIITAANTFGTGADLDYVGRNILDAATLDRFDIISVDYDRTLERHLYPDFDVLEFMWAFRDAVNISKIHHIVSTRGIGKVYRKEMNGISPREILLSNVVKNLNQDDLNTILGQMKECSKQNKFYRELTNLTKGR